MDAEPAEKDQALPESVERAIAMFENAIREDARTKNNEQVAQHVGFARTQLREVILESLPGRKAAPEAGA